MHIEKDNMGGYQLYNGRDLIIRMSQKDITDLMIQKYNSDNPDRKIVPISEQFLKMTMKDDLVRDIRYYIFNTGVIQAVKTLRTKHPELVLSDAKQIVEYFASLQKYMNGE